MQRRRALALTSAVGALLATLLVAWWVAPPVLHRLSDSGATWHVPVVLWVEEREHATRRRESTVPRVLEETFKTLFPDKPIAWRFLAVDPTNIEDLRGAIALEEPQLVIFANQNFLPALEGWSNPIDVLSPTERAPHVIERLFGSMRLQRGIAFISWYPAAEGKLVEHLRTLSQGRVKRVAVFVDPSLSHAGVDAAFREAAKQHDIEVRTFQYRQFEELVWLLPQSVYESRPDALFIPMSNQIVLYREEVARLANATGLPAVYSRRDQVARGGLIAVDAPYTHCGDSQTEDPPERCAEIWQHIARYTALILQGADPSKLDILVPSRLETTVNLATARELRIVLPYELLIEAREFLPR